MAGFALKINEAMEEFGVKPGMVLKMCFFMFDQDTDATFDTLDSIQLYCVSHPMTLRP